MLCPCLARPNAITTSGTSAGQVPYSVARTPWTSDATIQAEEQALAAVAEDAPDVLVSDIGTPGMDGYELLRRVRALRPENGGLVPAIALTYARADDRVKAVRAGFQMHVPKPVEPAELITMVASLAGSRGSL